MSTDKRQIVFAAGGTGGHIVPALAVARTLRALAPDLEITFFGVGRELEQKLIPAAGFRHEIIPFVPLLGSGLLGKARMLLSFIPAYRRCSKLFDELKPVAVVGFGGYPSFVPMICGWRRRIPLILQEQNVMMGVANRFLAKLADLIFVPPHVIGPNLGTRGVELSLPVKEEFYRVAPWVDPEGSRPLNLLIIGGSQGARSLNDAAIALIPVFRELGVRVFHQTGRVDGERILEEYRRHDFQDVEVLPFIENMPQTLSQVDLVISRAGASAVAELAVTGRPTIFVPLKIAQAHQGANVERLGWTGAAVVVEQDGEFIATLSRELRGLVRDRSRMRSLSEAFRASYGAVDGPRPAEVIANRIINSIR